MSEELTEERKREICAVIAEKCEGWHPFKYRLQSINAVVNCLVNPNSTAKEFEETEYWKRGWATDGELSPHIGKEETDYFTDLNAISRAEQAWLAEHPDWKIEMQFYAAVFVANSIHAKEPVRVSYISMPDHLIDSKCGEDEATARTLALFAAVEEEEKGGRDDR